MFTPRISAVLGGLIVAALSFTTPTEAAGKLGLGMPQVHLGGGAIAQGIQVAPTGDGPADDKECAKYETAINSWLDAQAEALEGLDEAGTRTADRNVNGLINDATDRGCFIIY